MSSTIAAVPASNRAGRRFPLLLLSRVYEQAGLGGAALLLAARLGAESFAPLAVLFVVTSAAVTLSDFGVGLAVLRAAPGEEVARRARTRMRLINGSLLVVAVVTGVVFGGDLGMLVAGGAMIWVTSAEAFVEKAAVINGGMGERAAGAEVVGTTLFLVPVVLWGFGSAALGVTILALVAKQVVEALVAGWRATGTFATKGTAPELGALWSTQAIAFAVANVDYVVVGLTMGPAVFSVYTIAYRFAVAIPSMVAYVASRTALADLSGAEDAAVLEHRYVEYIRRLFAVGVVAAAAVALGALALPAIMGPQWSRITPTVAVLAIAVPWRMVFGQAGALAISVRRTSFVVKWELVQLLLFAAAFLVASTFGYAWFVAVATISWILVVTLFERGAAACAGVRGWPVLRFAAVVASALALVAGLGFRP